MTSILDGLRADVTAAFDGTLRDGTLWRAGDATDPFDPDHTIPGGGPFEQVSTFEGLRASYSAEWAQAGIPLTDVKIEMLASSLSTAPVQGDKLNIEAAWWLVTAVEVDPAGAWFTCQSRLTSAP